MDTQITDAWLVDRLAEVSHATWMHQSVRDGGRHLDELPTFEPQPPVEDSTAAAQILAAVLAGESLANLSQFPGHQVGPHDLERANSTVTELKRLGLVKTG